MNKTSICSKCKKEKDATEFYKDNKRPNKLTSWCKQCSKDKSKEYYQNNKEKAKESQKKWKKENKERIKFLKAKSSYNITEEEYNSLKRVCVICGSKENLCIDHSHQSGRIRGMLCSSCNKGLGFFNDNPTILYRAAEYILGISKPDIFEKTYESADKTNTIEIRDWDWQCGEPGCCSDYGADLIINGELITDRFDMYAELEKILKALNVEYEIVEGNEEV